MARLGSRERKLKRELHRRMALFNERKRDEYWGVTDAHLMSRHKRRPLDPRLGMRTEGRSWDDKVGTGPPRRHDAVLDTLGQLKPTGSSLSLAGPYPVPIEHYIKRVIREA